ncbi:MAG: hypothetical protein ABWZ88_16210 [Variovorax sp.]
MLPLSGDVTQAINPWSWFFKSVGGQFGLVNINMGKSSDPVLEQQILDDVGTYGRQLGQIGDALAVLLRHVKLEDLAPDEVDALDAFKLQLAQIERLKARR